MAALTKQVRQLLDDHVRCDRCKTLRHCRPVPIHPHSMYPELLRCAHIPLDVVTHAPGIRGTGAQREQSISVNPCVRLAKPLLTFDHDAVEVLRQVEPLYLPALCRGRAVGEKGKRYAALAQRFKRLQRSGEETDKLITS